MNCFFDYSNCEFEQNSYQKCTMAVGKTCWHDQWQWRYVLRLVGCAEPELWNRSKQLELERSALDLTLESAKMAVEQH